MEPAERSLAEYHGIDEKPYHHSWNGEKGIENVFNQSFEPEIGDRECDSGRNTDNGSDQRAGESEPQRSEYDCGHIRIHREDHAYGFFQCLSQIAQSVTSRT